MDSMATLGPVSTLQTALLGQETGAKKKIVSKEKFNRIYESAKSIWSKIGRSVAASRKILQASLKKIHEDTQLFLKINTVASRLRLVGFVSLPLSVESFISSSFSIHKNRKAGDVEGVALGVIGQVGAGLEFIDSVNTLVEGVTDFMSLSSTVENTLGAISSTIPYVAMGAAVAGITTRSMQIDRERKIIRQIKELNKHVQDTTMQISLLQSTIGVTGEEERKIAQKVGKISTKKFAQLDTDKRKNMEEKLHNTLKTRVIVRKERAIERATTAKAVTLLKEMKENQTEMEPEKKKAIFGEMRRVIQRKIAFQAAGIARSLVSFTALVILVAALSPIVAFSMLAGSLLSSVALDLAEKPLVHRGLQHI